MSPSRPDEPDPTPLSRTALLRSVSWALTTFLAIFIVGVLAIVARTERSVEDAGPWPSGLGDDRAPEGPGVVADTDAWGRDLSPRASAFERLLEAGHDPRKIREAITLLELGDSFVYDLKPAEAEAHWSAALDVLDADFGARERIELYRRFADQNAARAARGERPWGPEVLRERFYARFAP